MDNARRLADRLRPSDTLVQWAILDFEASGRCQTSYPIEVGICQKDGLPQSTLINPLSADDWQHWDSLSAQVHGISRNYIEEHGDTVTDVCQFLNRELQHSQVVLCDSEWDLFWLGRLYRAAHMRPAFTLLEVNQWLAQQKRIDKAKYASIYEAIGPASKRAGADAAQINKALSLLIDQAS